MIKECEKFNFKILEININHFEETIDKMHDIILNQIEKAYLAGEFWLHLSLLISYSHTLIILTQNFGHHLKITFALLIVKYSFLTPSGKDLTTG